MIRRLLLLAATCFIAAPEVVARPVTVADSIELTELGEPWGDLLGKPVAIFSPDGTTFAVIAHRGEIKSNTNRYTLLAFDTTASVAGKQPVELATVESASNYPGISDVRWLRQASIVFLVASGAEKRQVAALTVSDRRMEVLTDHATDIVAFDIDEETGALVYVAKPSVRSYWTERTRQTGLVVSDQYVGDLLMGHPWEGDEAGVDSPLEVFIKEPGRAARPIDLQGHRPNPYAPSLSPHGRWLVLKTWVRKSDVTRTWAAFKTKMAPDTLPMEYLLVDLKVGTARRLLDAPVGDPAAANMSWVSDSVIRLTNTYAPVTMTAGGNPEQLFTMDVTVESGAAKIVDSAKSGRRPTLSNDRRPQIYTRQGLNSPPRLMAKVRPDGTEVEIFDPNPQMADLSLARVEEVTWTDKRGEVIKCGLYLPSGYKEAGAPLPVVLQTHGWSHDSFSMDGLPSAAGYAAQALAARGIAVMQLPDVEKWESTIDEGSRYTALHESAIDYLKARGLVDETRIGILGWSRTGYHVRHTLTFSRVQFAAAVIADGMDASYGQYLSYLNQGSEAVNVYEAMNGGKPFGSGLQTWIDRATGFNLENVHTPTRLLTFIPSVLLNNWEWFSVLKYLQRPVELIWLPEAAHSPVRPSERLVAQQGTVQWFDFWLNGRRDPGGDAEQYARWERMRSRTSPAFE